MHKRSADYRLRENIRRSASRKGFRLISNCQGPMPFALQSKKPGCDPVMFADLGDVAEVLADLGDIVGDIKAKLDKRTITATHRRPRPMAANNLPNIERKPRNFVHVRTEQVKVDPTLQRTAPNKTMQVTPEGKVEVRPNLRGGYSD